MTKRPALKSVWLCGAICLSGLLHAASAAWTKPQIQPVLEGGVVAGEIALGLGFDDLVKATAGAKSLSVTPQKSHVATPVPRLSPTVSEPVMAKLSDVSQQSAIAATSRVQATDPPKTISRKPQVKPPVAPEKLASKPEKQSVAAVVQRGNAVVSASKGQAQGTQQGRQAEASKTARKTTAKVAGDGAVRSYQSTVLRKISRVPKRAAGARGKALVGLTISASGQISKAAIVKSSGHAKIDKVALAQIKRAGPFAPTPTGQSLSVVVRFDSKG